jgi:glycyl-tRNA synthetase beta chain
MKYTFTFELYCEEIPAKMQDYALKQFRQISYETLQKNQLNFQEQNLITHISCNRLILILTNLSAKQIKESVKKIGPNINSNQFAIDGFLKANQLNNISQLNIENNFFVYQTVPQNIDTTHIITQSLLSILQKMQNIWQKSMKMPNHQQCTNFWIRPVRNLLAMFENKIVDFSFFNLTTNNIVNIDKFQQIKLNQASEYLNVLQQHKIMFSQSDRINFILQQLQKLLQKNNLVLIEENSSLLQEVAGLSEKIAVLQAEIQPNFLSLPPEALIVTLENNQKYFLALDKQNQLAPFFFFTTNQLNTNFHQKIILDNQKVVDARLSDLKFFIEEDLKQPLINYLIKLKNINFHQDLGSVFAKTQRINDLAKFMAVFIPHCNLNQIELACNLAKCDLATKAVAEMPELQGKIGAFYASQQQQNQDIIEAIQQHYLPNSANSALPTNPLAVNLSLADKIDSLVGFFLINQKPTSSKDPFALRRQALGIIKTIWHHNLSIPLELVLKRALNNFPSKIFIQQKQIKACKNFQNIIIDEIKMFLIERLKFFLKDQLNVSLYLIEWFISQYPKLNIANLINNVLLLNDFLKSDNSQNLLTSYKRAINLLNESNISQLNFINKVKCKLNIEQELNKQTKQLLKPIKNSLQQADFSKIISLINSFSDVLQDFLNQVTINDQDQKNKQQKLFLLNNAVFLISMAIPFPNN